MNYKIISDEKLLTDFIDNLPDLKFGEIYYFGLIARRKYSTTTKLSSDRIGLKVITSTKERIIDKIKQLEIPVGTYLDYKKGREIINQEAIGLYMYLNPRNFKKANIRFCKELVENGFSDDRNLQYRDPIVWSKTNVARSKSETHFLDFDFDYDGEKFGSKEFWMDLIKVDMKNILNKEAYRILETRGGVHLIIELSKVEDKFKQSWHLDVMRAFKDMIDLPNSPKLKNNSGNKKKDNEIMTPVPGCIQGGFVPRFLNLNN